jgi:hypothetical protein
MSPQRQVLRYLFGVSATLSDRQGVGSVDVDIHNISLHGCCLQTGEVLEPGEERTITVHWRGAEIPVAADVIWSDREGRAGFRFHTIPKASRTLLGELCTTLRIQSSALAARDAA